MNVSRKEIRGLIALAVVLIAVLCVLWLTRGVRGVARLSAVEPVSVAADSVAVAVDSVAADSLGVHMRAVPALGKPKSTSKKRATASDRSSPLDNVNS